MDYPALVTALAATYTGLANVDSSDTLRASYDVAPDAPVVPCAITLLAGLENVEAQGMTYLVGDAMLDVLVLLEPSADVPRRNSALLRWVSPALTAALSSVQLGMTGSIAGAVPVDLEVSLAGESEVYAGLPWDSVRVRYRVPFLHRVEIVT